MTRWIRTLLLLGLLALPLHGFSHGQDGADEPAGADSLHCPLCHIAEVDDMLAGSGPAVCIQRGVLSLAPGRLAGGTRQADYNPALPRGPPRTHS